MLLLAVHYKYIPACREYASLLLQEPNTQSNGLELLRVLSLEYHDILSQYQYATILMFSQKKFEDSISLYQGIADEYKPACYQLGLIYSPFSKIGYPNKDPQLAL